MPRYSKSFVSMALLAAAAGLVATELSVFAEPPAVSAAADHSADKATTSTRRALDRPLPEVKFNANPLSDVLDFLADATNANFSVDWKALEAAHIAKDTPITLRMSSQVSLRKVLELVLDQAAGKGVLTFYSSEGVIEITSQESSDKVMISRTYPIQDLLFEPEDATMSPNLSLQNASQNQTGGGGGGSGGGGGGGQSLFDNANSNSNSEKKTAQSDRATEIIKLITDTVKPELWQINGGTATISFYRGNLIVNAPRSIHQLLESQ